MSTTIESTSETDRLVALLPEPHRTLVLDCLNARSKRKAHALRNTQARSEAIRAGIIKAIEHHRCQLDVLGPHGRTSFLLKRMQADPGKYGMEKAPDSEVLRTTIDKYMPTSN